MSAKTSTIKAQKKAPIEAPKKAPIKVQKKAPIKADSKENHSADAKNFLSGDLDEKKYEIVDIATQYHFTYKNMETGRKTRVIRASYFNLKTMKFRFHKSVWGTKQVYINLKRGRIVEFWKKGERYGDSQKIDPQLEYESKVFACLVGAIVFAFLFMIFAWIVRKITLAAFGSTKQSKRIKLLDIDAPGQDWIVNDISLKKEFNAASVTALTL